MSQANNFILSVQSPLQILRRHLSAVLVQHLFAKLAILEMECNLLKNMVEAMNKDVLLITFDQ
jgi:hypothetical protein